MSVTVTVNGVSGASVVATNGDTISAAVTKNAVISVTASPAAAPGATGPQGPAGTGGGASLSDATPAALGTAAAGTSSTASRSDHVHSSPAISGVTGLQAALDAKQAAGSYAAASHTHTASQISDLATSVVTSVNGQVGAVTVSGGSGGSSYTLPIATASVLGGCKQGANVTIAGDGTLSVAAPVTTLAATAITGLATVATSGSYADLSNKPTIPSAYSLPVATASVLGGVKAGANVTIAADGTVSVAAPVTTLAAGSITGLAAVATTGSASDLSAGTVPVARLPAATTTTAGAVVVGSGLSVASGTVSAAVTSVAARTGAVVLTASDVGLGSVSNTSDAAKPVSTAQAAADAAVQAFAIQRANHTGSQAASTITGLAAVATSGSASDLATGTVPAARLPAATTSLVGGVSIGGGLSITGAGALSVELAPGAPTSIADGGGTLSWAASTTGTSAAYDTQQTYDGGATYTNYFLNVTGTSVGNFDASRKFRVRARNAAGLYGPWGYQSGLTAQVEAKSLTIGSGFTTTDGTLTALGGGGSYTLPNATTTTLGGVIVGTGLAVSAGTVSAAVTSVATRTGAVVLSIGDIAGLQAALDDLSARIASGSGGATITISAQPSNQTASGGAATFSATASVTPAATLSYQWQRQALGTGSYVPVSGANSATLSLTGLTNAANNSDNYRVIVSASGATSVTSNSASLTVASASLLSIARNNGTSTFTGSGTAASPFTRATSLALDAADGLSRYSWTANASATVTLVFSYRDDDGAGEQYQIKRTRSGSTSEIHSGTNGTGITLTVSVISGDVITFSSTGYPPAQYFSGVSVSAA